jgi:hypothetical protein
MDNSKEKNAGKDLKDPIKDTPEDKDSSLVASGKGLVDSGKGYHSLAPLDPQELRRHIDLLARSPFRDALTEAFIGKPDVESIKEFANKYPDRWAQMISILSKISGYTPELKIDADIETSVKTLSLADVINRMKDAEAELEGLEGLPIGLFKKFLDVEDADIIEVKPVEDKEKDKDSSKPLEGNAPEGKSYKEGAPEVLQKRRGGGA